MLRQKHPYHFGYKACSHAAGFFYSNWEKTESASDFCKDYYAFGMLLPNRIYSADSTGSGGSRYGFNGQEKDDEVYGKGNSTTAMFWQYDARLGRRWNIDPMAYKYPWQSPYACFNNNPIYYSDPLGLEGTNDEEKTNTTTHTVKSGETLTSLAEAFSSEHFIVTPQMIMDATETDWNSERRKGNQNWIFVGESLNIPVAPGVLFSEGEIDGFKQEVVGRPDGGCIGVAKRGVDKLLPTIDATQASMMSNKENQLENQVGLVDQVLRPAGAIVDGFQVDAVMENGNRPVAKDQSPHHLYKNVQASVDLCIKTYGSTENCQTITSGYYVFAMSVMNGNHAMTLIVDYTDVDNPEYYLSDQVAGRTNGFRNVKDMTGGSLDRWLLQYNKDTYYRPDWGINSPQATKNFIWMIQKPGQ